MANILSGQIIAIGQTQTIASKSGGNPIIKREFVIRALAFNRHDGTPELSERNTPMIELQGQDNVRLIDNFKIGDCVRVEFSIEGRSVQNADGTTRYFDSVRGYRIDKLNIQLPMTQQPAQQAVPQQPAPQQNNPYQGANAPSF